MDKHLNLLEYELYGKDCLAGKLPPCSATCPLNVNIRDMVGYIQKENFTAAYRIYRDNTVFPHIVSEICREACKKNCVRADKDEAIRFRTLEQSVVAYASSTVPPRFNLPKKPQKISVIGGGLSGLACANRLGAKGYNVSLYEKTDRLGGCLNGVLSDDILHGEIEKQTQFSNIRYEMNHPVSVLDELDYDAVFIATGKGGTDFGLLGAQLQKSFATEHAGIFAGGAILGADPVSAIAHAIVAAHSIEKYLKIGYMDGIPESFMIEESKITVSLKNVQTEHAVKPMPGGIYTEDEAVRESLRCLRCDCTYCMDACELFGHFKKMPRQMIGEAFSSMHTGKGSITKQTSTHVISSCNLCGLCENVCPEGIDIGKMAYDFRHYKMLENKYPKAYGEYYLKDMDFSNTEAALFRKAPGSGETPYLFFPGCQLGASNPRFVTESWKYLLEWCSGTGILIQCCGAPADLSGRPHDSDKVINSIKKIWEKLNKPAIICVCPTCMKHFERFFPEALLISLYEIIDSCGLPETAKAPQDKNITVFDPCSSRHFNDMQRSVREILQKIGAQLEDLPYSGENARCCGTGAQTLSANPVLTDIIVQNRIRESDNYYINYCTNCRDTFLLWEKECCHVLDIVFGLTPPSSPHSLGKRRENKMEAKAMILQDFFGEECNERSENEDMEIIISPELLKKMSKYLIVEHEIAETIRFCEKTQNLILDRGTGHYFGHYQTGRTTYWVEYVKENSAYILLNAYTHRIEILEEDGRDG